jgi:hypothetical protein
LRYSIDTVGGTLLVNGQHTYKACTDAGGMVVDTDVSTKQCRFNAGACPSGWSWYKGYATVETPKTCTSTYGCRYGAVSFSCSMGARPFSDGGLTCTYSVACSGCCVYACKPGDCGWLTCTAVATQIGCY